MGKVFMKAVQQQVFNLNKSGEKSMAYVLRPTRYSTIDEKQIVEYCVQNSMVPKAYISAAMVALAQCFTNFLLNGHHVMFPNLGVFSLTSTGYAEGDVDKAGLDQLKKLNVRFLPCKELKQMVENVDVELDGVFDIAGETILEEATDTTEAKTQKYYKRVNRALTVDADGNPSTNSGTGSGTGSSQQGTGNGTSGNGSGSGSRQYTITVTSANTDQGTVTGGGTYTEGSRVSLVATPKSGFAFDQWSDGNTQPSRSIIVSQNLSLTASFKTYVQSGGTGTSDEDDDTSNGFL